MGSGVSQPLPAENEGVTMTDSPQEPDRSEPATDPQPAVPEQQHHHGPSGDWASRPDADAHRAGVAADSAHWTGHQSADRGAGAISSADWAGGHQPAVPSHWPEHDAGTHGKPAIPASDASAAAVDDDD